MASHVAGAGPRRRHAGPADGPVFCGAVLYEMATGRLSLFAGNTSAIIFDRDLNQRADRRPSDTQSGPARSTRGRINKCLEKDRGLRYQTASDLRADL